MNKIRVAPLTMSERNKHTGVPRKIRLMKALGFKLKVIQAPDYNPPGKPPSQRDLHRMQVAYRKATGTVIS